MQSPVYIIQHVTSFDVNQHSKCLYHSVWWIAYRMYHMADFFCFDFGMLWEGNTQCPVTSLFPP
jgi:hypothetical protein